MKQPPRKSVDGKKKTRGFIVDKGEETYRLVTRPDIEMLNRARDEIYSHVTKGRNVITSNWISNQSKASGMPEEVFLSAITFFLNRRLLRPTQISKKVFAELQKISRLK